MKIVQLVLLSIFLAITQQSHCNSHPKPPTTNDKPIWDGEPVLIKKVPHGKLYQVGSPQTNNTMDLIHVYGSMYQMGYAQGLIYGDRVQAFIDGVYDYVVEEVSPDLPKWMNKKMKESTIIEGGNFLLDLTYDLTKNYTNPKYYEELKGLCDASGADYEKLKRLQMFGELTKGHCSMLGAWGKSTVNGDLIQLRSLDWEFEEGPFKDFTSIVIYHPAEGEGNKFANFGLVGFLGSLTGQNEHQMAISEIGVSYPVTDPSEGPSFGEESRVGKPFTFALRDIIQFETSLDGAIEFLQNTNRTCDLILGVGDAKSDKHFRAFQYSYSVCNVISDTNLLPKADWHPQIEDTVYFGMDWNCPNWDERFAQLINEYYGQISGEFMVSHIVPGLSSGNLQVAVYDLTNQFTYISYGFIDGDYMANAYENAFVKLDMKKLFEHNYDD